MTLIQSDEQYLQTILRAWGQFPAGTDDDFNCLVREVMSTLNEGSDRETLEAVIQNEFFCHQGAYGPVEEIMNIAKAISDWWSMKNPI
jgi:hypothetical protein